ncbi:MAG: hypothetical protein M3P49_06675 [Actinomycetota bacterium]|nr:hypothetical protein [Actinomycetota bacterium]
MARCAGFKGDGTPCQSIVGASQTYCYAHDPARAQERKRNASKAGRGRGASELAGIKALLSELTDRVLGEQGTEPLANGNAAVANQLLNSRLRAVEITRKVKETDELEARIEALEEASQRRRGG